MDQHTKTALATIGASIITGLAAFAVGYLGYIKPSEKQLATSPIVIELRQTNESQTTLISTLQARQAELLKENEALRKQLVPPPPPATTGAGGPAIRTSKSVSGHNQRVSFDDGSSAFIETSWASGDARLNVNGKTATERRTLVSSTEKINCFIEYAGRFPDESKAKAFRFQIDHICLPK